MRKIYSFALVLVIVVSWGCKSGKDAGIETNAGPTPGEMWRTSSPDQITPPNHIDGKLLQSSPDAARAPYDRQFLDTMIANHQLAVQMAQLASVRAEHPLTKALARWIISDHESEISRMMAWRKMWYSGEPTARNIEMPGMRQSMTDLDLNKLETLEGKAFDAEFVRQIILHHEGGVELAKDALLHSEKKEIRNLSALRIKSQKSEIGKLHELEATLGGNPKK